MGGVSLIFIFFIALIVSWLWGAFSGIGFELVDSKILNFFIAIAMIAAAAFFVGLLVSWRWSRNLILLILSKIPGIGSIAHSFLNHDFVERLKKEELPEVVFRDIADRWAMGFVTNEFLAPENPETWISADHWNKSSLIEWCIVIGPPTTPLAITAPMYFIPKRNLAYTGRTAKDTAITAASFGFAFRLPQVITRLRSSP